MRKILLGIIFVASFLTLIIEPALAYTIDGLLTDWNIDLSALGANSAGYLDSHLPSGGLNIDYVTEDNAGPQTAWQYVGPGYTYYGNTFDTEAIYFDNDQYNAYIAVITGMPFNGSTAPNNPWFLPGDIAIDVNNNSSYYEFGIDVSSYNAGTKKANLIGNPIWQGSYYPQYSIANPWAMSNGTLIDAVDFVYSGVQNTHYVLEAMVPLSLLGMNADSIKPIGIHWAMECGNDYLNLNANVNPVPEPATLSLLGLGLLGLIPFRKRKFS